MNTSTGLRCGSNRAVGSKQQQAARNAAGRAIGSVREACKPTRHSRALAVSCKATVQLEVPKTVTAPRQVPAKSVSLEPVVQEATAHYGKPLRGSPTTLGATYVKDADAINFALTSGSAKGVKLVLFTEDDLAMGKATYEVQLDPATNKTGDVWHIALPQCDTSLLYAYRVTGENQDKNNAPSAVGHKFDEVEHHKEVEAWKVALCLMHPLDPTCGRSPSSLLTTCTIRPLVALADKYNLAGLLPYAKDMLLDPRSSYGVPGIHDCYKLDALEWIGIAEGVPGFEAVVVRCISQIVASVTSARGRSQRVAGAADQPRYRAHEALMSAMCGLRPETCAKLAASLASCLAVACENMANQDRYSIKPVGEHTPWGWEYQYEPLRK
uniref:Glycoside hydrolase family 13 N-terminal domain-containing protein n=1 Tax=Tetradesmus obliquus TaxID=3088 RepID=A0A383V8Q1_TETOB|eukprot:jgi/Sobl393_1/6124/SZX61551.1